MKLLSVFFLFFSLLFSQIVTAKDIQSEIEGSEISLLDHLRIQGAYTVTTEYFYPTESGVRSSVYLPMNKFVLMYSPKTKSIIASFSNTKEDAFRPIVTFKDLKTEYEDESKSSILLSGFGGGKELGRLEMKIEIASGELTARFSDTIAIGMKVVTGSRDFNLEKYIPLEKAKAISQASDFVGIYATNDPNEEECGGVNGGNTKLHHWKMILRTDVLPGPSVSLISGRNPKYFSSDRGKSPCYGTERRFEMGTFTPEFKMFEFSTRNNGTNVMTAGTLNLYIDPDTPNTIYAHFFNFNGLNKVRTFHKVGDLLTFDNFN